MSIGAWGWTAGCSHTQVLRENQAEQSEDRPGRMVCGNFKEEEYPEHWFEGYGLAESKEKLLREGFEVRGGKCHAPPKQNMIAREEVIW